MLNNEMLGRQIDVVRTFIQEEGQEKGNVSGQMAMDSLRIIEQQMKADGGPALDGRRYITRNEAIKLRVYAERLRGILERDGTIKQFEGSTDYLMRSAIEALGLSELFYDPVIPHNGE